MAAGVRLQIPMGVVMEPTAMLNFGDWHDVCNALSDYQDRPRPAATSSYGGGVVEAKRNRWTNWLY